MNESTRVLTKEEAAAYCVCKTLAAFDQWRKKGIVPDAIVRSPQFVLGAGAFWLVVGATIYLVR